MLMTLQLAAHANFIAIKLTRPVRVVVKYGQSSQSAEVQCRRKPRTLPTQTMQSQSSCNVWAAILANQQNSLRQLVYAITLLPRQTVTLTYVKVTALVSSLSSTSDETLATINISKFHDNGAHEQKTKPV